MLTQINPYSIGPFLSGVLALGLSVFFFFQNRTSKLNRLFSALSGFVAFLPLSVGIFLNLHDPNAIMYWTKFGHITCTIVPPLYVDFVSTLLRRPTNKLAIRLFYCWGVSTVFLMWLTDWYFPGGIHYFAWGPYAKPGPLIALYAFLGP